MPDALDLHEQLVRMHTDDGAERRAVLAVEELITDLDGYLLRHNEANVARSRPDS